MDSHQKTPLPQRFPSNRDLNYGKMIKSPSNIELELELITEYAEDKNFGSPSHVDGARVNHPVQVDISYSKESRNGSEPSIKRYKEETEPNSVI